MALQLVDLYHGAVFSKILKTAPNNISILESYPEQGRYVLDTEKTSHLDLVIKYAASPRGTKHKGLSWTFSGIEASTTRAYALVCVDSSPKNFQEQTYEVCYISPQKLTELFSTCTAEAKGKTNVSLSVSLKPKCYFDVSCHHNKPIKIARSAIEGI